MRPMDETRERFLASIAQRITGVGDQPAPPEGAGAVIEEVHVFPPMRQGGVESGVAVVAVTQPQSLESDVTGAAGAAEYGQLPAKRAAEYASSRFVVYTARYKLTIKGPDRGKWEFSMHPDADAPLHTVDKVVRGVQQRGGYADEVARLSGEEVLQAISARLRSAPSAPPL